jgi:hypothetical protein
MPIAILGFALTVVSVGATLLVAALATWTCPEPSRFVAYMLLGLLGALFKVRMPGANCNYSLTFFVAVLSSVELTIGQTVWIVAGAMAAQTLWRSEKRPRLIQVSFNAAIGAVASAGASLVAQPALALGTVAGSVVAFLLAGSVYFALNTALVSMMLVLEQRGRLLDIWKHWFDSSSRFSVIGVVVALAISLLSRYIGWSSAMMLLPLMYVEYLSFRISVLTHGAFFVKRSQS